MRMPEGLIYAPGFAMAALGSEAVSVPAAIGRVEPVRLDGDQIRFTSAHNKGAGALL
jgi:hypothetical protein